MKKFYLCSPGCTRRMLETQRIHDYLMTNGWTFVPRIREADLVIVATCGFSDSVEDESLNALKNVLRKRKKSARVIIAGCLPSINPSVVDELGDFTAITPRNLEDLDNILSVPVKWREIPEPNISHIPLIPEMRRKKFIHDFQPTPAFLKFLFRQSKDWISGKGRADDDKKFNIRVSEGCVGACSYCAIKRAIGPLKSKDVDEIVKEFKAGLEGGQRTINLASEDLGCYGLDQGVTFPQLLAKLFEIDGDYKLVLSDLNPQWLVKYHDELRPFIDENKDRIKQISIPIQSGSDRILQAMKRPYRIGEVVPILQALRAKMPDLELITNIMVGFPGETEEDFEASKKLLEAVKFSRVVVHKYSDRPDTVSSKMANKIPSKVIKRRYNELRASRDGKART